MLERSKLAAVAASEGAAAAAKAAAQARPATDWICDSGGLHGIGLPCDCSGDGS